MRESDILTSLRRPPPEPSIKNTSMLTATLTLAALVLLLATDHDDQRQAVPIDSREHDTR